MLYLYHARSSALSARGADTKMSLSRNFCSVNANVMKCNASRVPRLQPPSDINTVPPPLSFNIILGS
jgi:hypothetical protein